MRPFWRVYSYDFKACTEQKFRQKAGIFIAILSIAVLWSRPNIGDGRIFFTMPFLTSLFFFHRTLMIGSEDANKGRNRMVNLKLLIAFEMGLVGHCY